MLPHVEDDRFNLRYFDLDERLVVPGRIESSLKKKTRRFRTLLGANSGLTASLRNLQVSNSGALGFGSVSIAGALPFGSRSPASSG